MKIKKITLKKSQIKIQEMSFMIIGIFIFFTLVLLFYLSFSLTNLRQNVEVSSRSKNVLLLSSLAGTPEFSCPSTETVCIDEDKLLALKNHPIYASFWDVNGLVIERTFPEMNSTTECTLSNYPNCNKFTLVIPKNQSVADSTFVSLCRREKNTYTYQRCELGKILVWSTNTA